MKFIDNWRKEHEEAKPSWLAEAIGLSRKLLGRTEETGKDAELSESDAALKEKITDILFDFPYYGHRRVAAQFKRSGVCVNKKRIQRVMKATGLAQKRRRRFVKTTDSRHKLPTYPNLVKVIVPAYPKHIWVGDITYVRLEKGFCYVAILLDIFTRKVVGWAIAEHMEASLCIKALTLALEGGAPEFHHSDRGGQYCSVEYIQILTEHGVQISMADTGISVDNPYAESFNRTLKVEEVYLKEYRTFDDAEASIKQFIEDVYNTKRLHSSIGYKPPEEFEREWLLKNQPGVLLN